MLSKIQKYIFMFMLIVISFFHSEKSFCIQIFPGMGLSFNQVDLKFKDHIQLNSYYGIAIADYTSLYNQTGISTGYLNVLSDEGWIIRNLPVDMNSLYPGIGVMFNLQDSTDITTVNVYADLSPTPVNTFTGVPNTVYIVGTLTNNAQGGLNFRNYASGIRINLDSLTFDAGASNQNNTELNWQFGHESLEQDLNQCGPASVANSIEWLRSKKGLPVYEEYEYASSIRGTTSVGKLDRSMGRYEHSGISNYQFVSGKVKFIKDYIEKKEKDGFKIKHKQRPGFHELDGDIPSTGEYKSRENTEDISLIDWIISEIKHGEDVEVEISWGEGQDEAGHIVDLIGAGKILGAYWIAWTHDADQDFISDYTVKENGKNKWYDGGIQFSFVKNNKVLCYINGESITGQIDFASSESWNPVPLPVQIESFNSVVKGRNVTLDWNTSAEQNNNGFEIHRKWENTYWLNIGFVKGHGNSQSNCAYSFEDKNLNSGKYSYRLKQSDFNGNSRFYDLSGEVIISLPEKYYMSQNYPNPFNPSTRINFDIPQAKNVTIKIYDNTGREIKTLVSEFREAGYYTVEFNGSGFASGVYYYKIESGNFLATKKMVLLK